MASLQGTRCHAPLLNVPHKPQPPTTKKLYVHLRHLTSYTLCLRRFSVTVLRLFIFEILGLLCFYSMHTILHFKSLYYLQGYFPNTMTSITTTLHSKNYHFFELQQKNPQISSLKLMLYFKSLVFQCNKLQNGATVQ